MTDEAITDLPAALAEIARLRTELCRHINAWDGISEGEPEELAARYVLECSEHARMRTERDAALAVLRNITASLLGGELSVAHAPSCGFAKHTDDDTCSHTTCVGVWALDDALRLVGWKS